MHYFKPISVILRSPLDKIYGKIDRKVKKKFYRKKCYFQIIVYGFAKCLRVGVAPLLAAHIRANIRIGYNKNTSETRGIKNRMSPTSFDVNFIGYLVLNTTSLP